MAQQKVLQRLPEKGEVAGVAAGLAEYFNIDVSLIRVVFILFIFISAGTAILIYIILAIVLPTPKASKTKKSAEETIKDNVETIAEEMHDTSRGMRLRNYLGFGLIILGFWLLLGQFFPILQWQYIWPIILVAIGLLILKQGNR